MKYLEPGFPLELLAGLLGHRAAICSIADKEEKGEGGLWVSRRPEHRLEQSGAVQAGVRCDGGVRASSSWLGCLQISGQLWLLIPRNYRRASD